MAAAGGVTVVLAAPAVAETLEVSYTATENSADSKTAEWVFTPCGPDCVRVSAQSAELHANGGTWSGTFQLHDQTGQVVVCTRTVTPALTANDECPPPANITRNYQLIKN